MHHLRVNCSKIDGHRARQPANTNCCRLLHISCIIKARAVVFEAKTKQVTFKAKAKVRPMVFETKAKATK